MLFSLSIWSMRSFTPQTIFHRIVHPAAGHQWQYRRDQKQRHWHFTNPSHQLCIHRDDHCRDEITGYIAGKIQTNGFFINLVCSFLITFITLLAVQYHLAPHSAHKYSGSDYSNPLSSDNWFPGNKCVAAVYSRYHPPW